MNESDEYNEGFFKNCLYCMTTSGIPTYHECKNKCKYFVCSDCSSIWINKNGYFKCFHGCSIINLVSSMRDSNSIIVNAIISSLDSISDKFVRLLMSNSNSLIKLIFYIPISFLIIVFMIIPGMMIISIITVRTEEGGKMFIMFTVPVAALISIIFLTVSNT